MNLQKCDFCRKRKVKTSDSSFSTSLSNRHNAEVSTPLPRAESHGTEGIGVTLPKAVLMYQQMKDIVTVLRCHHTEYLIEISQSRWLERLFFRNYANSGEIDMKHFLEKLASRMRALSWIQKHTLSRVKSALQSPKYSSAERMLICQVLVELETSFSTSISDLETVNHRQNPAFATTQRNLAALLCRTGDYQGALTILHRIPLSQIEGNDLKRIVQFGLALCARAKTLPKVLGIGDDPMISAVFECLDVLVLPYSLLAANSSHWIDSGDFIKKSFTWPWIRRSIQAQLQDQPGAQVNWRPARLDTQFRDTFGHSILHAAIYSQDDGIITAVIENSLELGREDVRVYLGTACPSYAPGFTPLACSASSLGDWEIFHILLAFSGKDVCCGSRTGTAGHRFCVLAFAVRNHEIEVVKTLIQRSSQQRFNISDCCQWAMSWIPNIPRNIWDRLEEAGRQHEASGDEDMEILSTKSSHGLSI
ncbi:hypothetical protein LA080_000953 [Diaporthe eres]|nr:hypothetical protein LA080_000953 [Diaporthe eres]